MGLFDLTTAPARSDPADPTGAVPDDIITAARSAFDKWMSQPPKVGLGRQINPAANEYRKIDQFVSVLSQGQPFIESGKRLDRAALIPWAVDALIAKGVEFKSIPYSSHCIGYQIDNYRPKPPKIVYAPKPRPLTISDTLLAGSDAGDGPERKMAVIEAEFAKKFAEAIDKCRDDRAKSFVTGLIHADVQYALRQISGDLLAIRQAADRACGLPVFEPGKELVI